MAWLFLICATIGGTVLVCQFVLTVLGLGLDAEIADDFESGHDFSDGHSLDGDHVDTSHGDVGEDSVGHGNWSNYLFGVLSFKTIIAALAFFGLAGCAANSARLSQPAQVTIALLAGLAAMYGVHWIMRSIMRLGRDGTAKLSKAIGQEGTVYLTIPGKRNGLGKIQFNLQHRLVEYPASTACETSLKSGSKVRVVSIADDSTLVVESIET